jgi:hypothetical protein
MDCAHNSNEYSPEDGKLVTEYTVLITVCYIAAKRRIKSCETCCHSI